MEKMKSKEATPSNRKPKLPQWKRLKLSRWILTAAEHKRKREENAAHAEAFR